MSNRNTLRALTVGAPKKFRSKIVHLFAVSGEPPRPATPEETAAGENIIAIEVRQLSQGEMAAVKRSATVNGNFDDEKAVLQIVIAACFEPAKDADGKPVAGGTVKLFGPEDMESLEGQPANEPWLVELAAAAGHVVGMRRADLGKGSATSPSDSSR